MNLFEFNYNFNPDA